MNIEQIQIRLQDYYLRTFPQYGDVRISELSSINDGWESIIYTFNLLPGSNAGQQPQAMVLRIYPGTDAFYKSQREYDGLQVLYRAGFPVPKVYHLAREESPFDGRPFLLMEHIDGEMMWSVLDRAKPDQAAALITQFCELFVQLHRLDWRDFVLKDQHNAYQDPFSFVDRFVKMIHSEMEHQPELEAFAPVVVWLEERRSNVPCPWPAPVHWDFHPGNVILKPDGDAIVIDWTQIQVSDPRFDLGWTLLLVGAYAGQQVRDQILSEYQRIAGFSIEELAFFDVSNCLKRLGTVMLSLSGGADSMGMRPDAVEKMRSDFPALRRVYELMVARTGIQVAAVEQLLES